MAKIVEFANVHQNVSVLRALLLSMRHKVYVHVWKLRLIGVNTVRPKASTFTNTTRTGGESRMAVLGTEHVPSGSSRSLDDTQQTFGQCTATRPKQKQKNGEQQMRPKRWKFKLNYEFAADTRCKYMGSGIGNIYAMPMPLFILYPSCACSVLVAIDG